jgi:hypothetical protein
VGYGDMPARTIEEFILCLFWMAYGVSFYSLLVGSVTSQIAEAQKDTENLDYKLKALDNYRIRSSLDD